MSKVHLAHCFLHKENILVDGNLREMLIDAWGSADAILLGHAFDGVIWGRIKDRHLELASDAPNRIGALLRAETLMDLRVFDANREMRIWRGNSGLYALRLAEAEAGEAYDAYQDRSYELLRQPGVTRSEPAAFVKFEGLAGQLHAPPGEPIPKQLAVRHYFAQDQESGLLRTAQHRLLFLKT